MIPSTITDDLEFALTLMDAADTLTLHFFQSENLETETKEDETPVTKADRLVEEQLTAMINKERPFDHILGEEFGVSEGKGGRRWIIDPVDGTAGYLRGQQVWATLLALEEDGDIILGIVSAPAMNKRWWASKGKGTWSAPCRPEGANQQAARCFVSKVASLRNSQFSFSSPWSWAEADVLPSLLDLCSNSERSRGFGDFLSHVMVAEGTIDYACEPITSLWDYAAFIPIIEEAGGKITNFSNLKNLTSTSLICSNGLLHERIIRAIEHPSVHVRYSLHNSDDEPVLEREY
ncbi:histidinol-phosphatase [Paenibacillus shirakamiensis]|uniref:Histidinol-phosphatase n=1 Tax=Paenibacillus shirakamiensis TaxID=1265935 RepID=A0ABS4JE03_9BACL|nr:inositol monophosphatase family protein [Paenibacillus shirakamiensis]MBP1999939.1 histidinol-phosphatase [Paenibacillus shirakamiensis]